MPSSKPTGKSSTDPRATDRYSYSFVGEGESATVASNRNMLATGTVTVDGTLNVDGSVTFVN